MNTIIKNYILLVVSNKLTIEFIKYYNLFIVIYNLCSIALW